MTVPPEASRVMDYYALDPLDEVDRHDYGRDTELNTATCAAQILGANPSCTNVCPNSPNRFVCDICQRCSSNTSFTAIFLDGNARHIRQATVGTINRFKKVHWNQIEHMMNGRFTNLYRDCGGARLWEICYKCVGQMREGDEDHY